MLESKPAIVVVVLVFLSATLASTTEAQIEFDAPRAAWIGLETRQVEIGDFDEDGFPDLVGVCADGVRISRARDGLRFRAPREIESPASGAKIEIGDLDQDGHLDIVIETATSLVLRFGDGTGRFPRRSVIEVSGSDPWWELDSFELVDVDGNGNLDIVRLFESTMFTFAGDGTGSFAAPVATDIGVRAYGIIANDFDGNGLADVATITQRGIVVMLANREGAFVESERFGDRGILHFATGDWNGDGKADIAFTTERTLELRLGDGHGGFPMHRSVDFGGQAWTQSLSCLPASDGFHDTVLVVVGEFPSDFHLARYAFTDPRQLERVESVPLEDGLFETRFADLDLDGDLDWVAAGNSSILTILHREDGAVTHDPPRRIETGLGSGSPVSAFDFDDDGDIDLLTETGYAFRNDGPLGFTETDFLASRFPLGIDGLLVADLTADGRDDLLVQSSERELDVIPAGRANTVSAMRRSEFGLRFDPKFASDVDGDGNADLVGRFPDGRGLIVFGRGHGVFEEHSQPRTAPLARLSGDLNGDGIDDMIATPSGEEAVHVTAGDPSRGFTRTRRVDLGTRLGPGFDAGDLNDDGIVDIVYYHEDSREIRLALSADGRGMQQIRTIGRGIPHYTTVRLQLHDLDADGHLDLAMSIQPYRPHGMLVRRGSGNGRFGHVEAWAIPPFSNDDGLTTFADVDGDGDDDLVHAVGISIDIIENDSRSTSALAR